MNGHSGSEGAAEQASQALDLQRLSEVIDRCGHLLPAQGPITVFVHHNTLHGFEDLPFNEAVRKAGAYLRVSALPERGPVSSRVAAGSDSL